MRSKREEKKGRSQVDVANGMSVSQSKRERKRKKNERELRPVTTTRDQRVLVGGEVLRG